MKYQPDKLAWVLVLLLACGTVARAGTLVHFRTTFGDMEIELFDQDKPATVSNFLQYVRAGRYVNTFIHRCNPTFVIQGGGFYVGSSGGTYYVYSVPTYAPVHNEFGTGKVYSNTYGTIAMAKQGGDTNSATSQWFFNLANNSFLDAPNSNNFFTVFGKVRRGTNVLEIFKSFVSTNLAPTRATNLIVDARPQLGSAFGELPLLMPALSIYNLLFVDIELLKVQVTRSNSQSQISWTSIAGVTNVVEYATQLPPSWRTLATTNGTGSAVTVTDAIPPGAATNRFYRVRVAY